MRAGLVRYACAYAHSASSVRMKRSALPLVRGVWGRVRRRRMSSDASMAANVAERYRHLASVE